MSMNRGRYAVHGSDSDSASEVQSGEWESEVDSYYSHQRRGSRRRSRQRRQPRTSRASSIAAQSVVTHISEEEEDTSSPEPRALRSNREQGRGAGGRNRKVVDLPFRYSGPSQNEPKSQAQADAKAARQSRVRGQAVAPRTKQPGSKARQARNRGRDRKHGGHTDRSESNERKRGRGFDADAARNRAAQRLHDHAAAQARREKAERKQRLHEEELERHRREEELHRRKSRMQRKPHAVPKKAKRKAKRPPAKTAAADSRQAPPASTATDLEPGTEGSDTLQQSDDSDERLSNASDHRGSDVDDALNSYSLADALATPRSHTSEPPPARATTPPSPPHANGRMAHTTPMSTARTSDTITPRTRARRNRGSVVGPVGRHGGYDLPHNSPRPKPGVPVAKLSAEERKAHRDACVGWIVLVVRVCNCVVTWCLLQVLLRCPELEHIALCIRL